MRSTCIFFLSVAAFVGAPAAAKCEPRFVEASQSINVSASEIGTGALTRENLNIRVENDGEGPCSGRLRFSYATPTDISPNATFQLSSGRQVIDILPDDSSAPSAKSDLSVSGIPNGKNGRTIPLDLSFASQWGILSGTQRWEILVSFVGESGIVTDTMVLYLNFLVPDAVELRIVGASGDDKIAEIRLGQLDSRKINRSDPFAIRVWSTSPYSVAFESENNGNLVKDGGGDRIPYILRIGGIQLESNGAGSKSMGRATGSLGDIHPMQVEVEPFVAQAGDYADRVSVTVTAG